MAQTMTASRTAYQNNFSHHHNPPSAPTAQADMHSSWHRPAHPPTTGIAGSASTESAASTATTTASQPAHPHHHAPAHTVAPARTRSHTHKKSDFYKNGKPVEIIVIDSTSPEPRPAQNATKRKRENSVSASTSVSAVTKRARKSHNDETVNQASSSTYTHTPHTVAWFQDEKGVYRAKEVIVPKFEEPSTATLPPCDDSEGHFIVVEDAMLTPRYKIIRLLGQGTFGKVVQCYDRHDNVYRAVKIIRAVQKYRDASKIELRVLSTLSRADPNNSKKCIHLQDCFDYRNHICVVTELLGMSVFDFLKGNNFVPFPPSHVQSFAKQMLESIAFLHSTNLVHTDLKPENILLVGNDSYEVRCNIRGYRTKKVLRNTEIRIIDFGSATFNDEYHSNLVSTRHYRAPEIIMNNGWSFPCDIWSIGCILVEFCTGDALFQTHDNLEHMAMMEPICGKISTRVVRQMSRSAQQKMFTRDYKLNFPNSDTTKQSKKYVKAMKTLEEIIRPDTELNRELVNLLHEIFVYDPARRITAEQALRHRYFTIPSEPPPARR